jgi:hypothetical protein
MLCYGSFSGFSVKALDKHVKRSHYPDPLKARLRLDECSTDKQVQGFLLPGLQARRWTKRPTLCPHTTAMCPHSTAVYVCMSAYHCCICVLILLLYLCVCPHTTAYVC